MPDTRNTLDEATIAAAEAEITASDRIDAVVKEMLGKFARTVDSRMMLPPADTEKRKEFFLLVKQLEVNLSLAVVDSLFPQTSSTA